MSDKKLPAMPGKSAPAERRESEILQTLDAMRREPVPTEERVVAFTCACTGKPFRVRFSRSDAAERFKVAGVEKVEEARASSGLFGPWRKGAQAAPEAFDLGEFYLQGWHCPWCGAGETANQLFRFAQCGECRALVCSGRSARLPDGEWFRCHDGCGHASWATSRLAYVDGSAGQRRGEAAQSRQDARLPVPAARLAPPKK